MRYLSWVFAGFLVAACSVSPKMDENSVASVNEDIKGSYTLVAVNGRTVPVVISHRGTPLSLISGLFTINADDTCTSTVVFRPQGSADVTRQATATFTREGPVLLMQWEGAGLTSGTIDGDTFTMNNEGAIFTYTKN